MAEPIQEEELGRISELVAEHFGLHFPPARWDDLRRGIAAAAKERGCNDPEAWLRKILANPSDRSQLATVAIHLTVGETYFFRENRNFEILAEHILPKLMRLRRGTEKHLRIWCAACCTGEEAYSIAIQLHRTLPNLRDWTITLLATDLNPQFLQKAAAGIFGQWSFREAPPWLKPLYFRPAPNGQFEVLPEIKQMVRFSTFNLVEDKPASPADDPNGMDVIFCRNVLMYFTPERANQVLQNLHRRQADKGWLIVSAGEVPHISLAGYSRVNFGGAILYRKETPGRAVQENQPHVMDFAPEPLQHYFSPFPLPPSDKEPLGHKNASTTPTELPETPHAVARSLANDGKLSEALACCDQWITTDKMNPIAHYLRAIIFQEQGHLDEAVLALNRTIYLNPDFILAHFALGNIARARHASGNAARHLKNALALLACLQAEEIVPESDGVTARRFIEIIQSLRDEEIAV